MNLVLTFIAIASTLCPWGLVMLMIYRYDSHLLIRRGIGTAFDGKGESIMRRCQMRLAFMSRETRKTLSRKKEAKNKVLNLVIPFPYLQSGRPLVWLAGLFVGICKRGSRTGPSLFLDIFDHFLGARKTCIGLRPWRKTVVVVN